MDLFIKYEIWNGAWCFKPSYSTDFSSFQQLDYCSWFKKKKQEIDVRIAAEQDSKQPTERQRHTLDFITHRQDELIQSIFRYYQNVIFPVYKYAIDIEENEIARDSSQLGIVMGITGIDIPLWDTPQSMPLYFLIQFDFRYDDEHGLYILFENDTPIDFFSEGELNYDAVGLFNNGLKNKNGNPLHVYISLLNGSPFFEGDYYFDEQISFSFPKGTYRIFIQCNQASFCRNFYVPYDLEKFSLQELITFK